MANSFVIFYVTCPDETTARHLGQELLGQKLVACANYFPISSAYWWEGALTSDDEWVALLKTKHSLEEAVEKAVSALHPYQTPCIMRLDARANQAYLDWITAVTTC